MALALAVRERMLDRYMETLHTVTAPQSHRKVVAYLSAEFLTGPHLGNNLLCLGMQGRGAGRAAGARPEPERSSRTGRGARPRKWRARPAGRLLHGLAGHARCAGDRLRHPLRVRHLRSGDPRRLAGRDDRQVAAPRQPLGNRAAGDQHLRAVRRPDRAPAATSRAAFACNGFPRRSSKGVPYDTVGARLSAGPRPTCCGCGGPRPSNRSTSTHSTSATTTGRSARRSRRKPSRRCSIRTTSRRPASTCVCSSSSSSSPARSRT